MRRPLDATLRRARAVLLAAAAVILTSFLPLQPGWSQGTNRNAAPVPGLPGELVDVAFEQKIHDELPLELAFRDEAGNEVQLGDYFGSRPVVLSLVYYECPMLCSMALNGLTRALRVLDLEMGAEYDVVTLSFDPDDTPELARAKKASYVQQLGKPEAQGGWHFLTGEPDAIDALTSAVGFSYVEDEQSGQYAHAAGVVVITPAGVIARYFLGLEYSPRDLRLGLVEASEGRVGSVIDQVLLYCFQYDPNTGTYSAVVMRIVRLAGAVSIVGIALLLWGLRRRARPHPATTSARLTSAAPGGS